MANYVKPEWLPTVPADDGRGPFYCYVLWSKDGGRTISDTRLMTSGTPGSTFRGVYELRKGTT